MKAFFILFITIFIPANLISQNSFTVVDSLTKKSLPFVAVLFKNDGLYTNKNGQIKLPSKNIDTLEIKLLGYYSKKIIKGKLKDTIYLKPKEEVLAPVILKGDHKDIIIPPGKRAKDFRTSPLNPEYSVFSILHPYKQSQDRLIKEITVQFDKAIPSSTRRKLRKNNVQALVRIHIYEIHNEKLDRSIYNSKPLKINPSKKDEIKIDLKGENIYFLETGLGVEVEFIKFISKNKMDITKPHIRPQLTGEKNQFFQSTTYIKSTLKQGQIYPINKMFNNPNINHKKTYNRNLCIGMIIN